MAKRKKVTVVVVGFPCVDVAVDVTRNQVQTGYGRFNYDKFNLKNVKAKMEKYDTCLKDGDEALSEMIAIVKAVMKVLRRQKDESKTKRG